MVEVSSQIQSVLSADLSHAGKKRKTERTAVKQRKRQNVEGERPLGTALSREADQQML